MCYHYVSVLVYDIDTKDLQLSAPTRIVRAPCFIPQKFEMVPSETGLKKLETRDNQNYKTANL
jgi:hypothetical protein